MSVVRIGLLGFGNVGRAVARAADATRGELRARGLDAGVTCALVRDVTRARPAAAPAPPLVDDVEAFFARDHDVVVEVLGGVEPARTLVARALDRGIPVVTANKSLLAAHGPSLHALATDRGASLRYEASALAGVPFIDTLARRPLVASVSRLTAILNGTSHFVVSAMDRDRLPFADALARAQALGLAEPDPANDIRGADAAEKLVLLGALVGAPGLRPDAFESTGIDLLEPEDLPAARRLGGVIKPVACAAFAREAVRAFVGPAFVDNAHPLARLDGRLSGIRLEGPYTGDLFFSGPGAGPDVTAATLLDDVVETVTAARRGSGNGAHGLAGDAETRHAARTVAAPVTPWFTRVRFPDAPNPVFVAELLGAHGVWLRRHDRPVSDRDRGVWYALAEPCPRPRIERALAALEAATGAATCAIRALES